MEICGPELEIHWSPQWIVALRLLRYTDRYTKWRTMRLNLLRYTDWYTQWRTVRLNLLRYTDSLNGELWCWVCWETLIDTRNGELWCWTSWALGENCCWSLGAVKFLMPQRKGGLPYYQKSSNLPSVDRWHYSVIMVTDTDWSNK